MAVFFLLIFIVALFFVFAIISLGLTILGKLVGGISNLIYLLTGRKVNRNSSQGNYNNYSRSSSAYGGNTSQTNNAGNNAGTGHHKPGEKVFQADDGEYVDFEEVKD